jgi:predicted phosphodiesterase
MNIVNVELPNYLNEVRIRVLADSHIGDGLADLKLVKKFIKDVEENNDMYLIVNGDLINNATRTSVSDSYGEVMTPDEQIDYLVDLLMPVKDKILVITSGNHEDRTYRTDGIKLIKRVARELGIEDRYVEVAYLLYVAFGKNRGRDNRKTVYSIYGKHGRGGGKRIGSKTNKLEDMAKIIDADVFLHSHTHMPAIFKLSRFRVDYRNRKKSRMNMLFVNTNAFLDYGGYGEEKGYPPASKDYPEIILEGYERKAKAVL